MAFNISFNQSISAPILTDSQTILINIKPLALLAIGIVIYSIFIFKFYRYLAKRDILMFGWSRNYSWDEGHMQKIFSILLYTLEYIILVPLIIFFWFLILTIILLFLSNNSASQIMLISMAIIAAVRMTAYYNEQLSVDLAKMIPFTLLGFFIIDMNFFSMNLVLTNAQDMFSNIDKLTFYLLFAVLVEFIMRIIQLIRNGIRKKQGIKKTLQKKKEKNKIIDDKNKIIEIN
ncbi:MAG: hypothetical protein ACP5N2_04120 [Candidatus Nanoarchaeia archaeon]